jgi:hypothetical protein
MCWRPGHQPEALLEGVELSGGGAQWQKVRSSGTCPQRGFGMPDSFSLPHSCHEVNSFLCYVFLPSYATSLQAQKDGSNWARTETSETVSQKSAFSPYKLFISGILSLYEKLTNTVPLILLIIFLNEISTQILSQLKINFSYLFQFLETDIKLCDDPSWLSVWPDWETSMKWVKNSSVCLWELFWRCSPHYHGQKLWTKNKCFFCLCQASCQGNKKAK